MREPRKPQRTTRRRTEGNQDRRLRSQQNPSPQRDPSSERTDTSDKNVKPSQLGRYKPPTNRPEFWNQAPRSARRSGSGAASRPDSFNLKGVLFGSSGRPGETNGTRRDLPQKSQNSDSRSKDSRSGLQPQAKSSDLRPARKVTRLESIRPVPLKDFRQADRESRSSTTLNSENRTAGLLQSDSESSRRRRQRQVSRPASPLMHVIRLLILGIGVGAIAGTLFSVLNPIAQTSSSAAYAEATPEDSASNNAGIDSFNAFSNTLRLGQEMTPLKTTVQQLASQVPGITPGVYLVDLDTGAYLDVGGTTSFPAASTIKVPVLVALLQEVDAGNVRLDEMMTIQESDLAEGSGEMQYQGVGTQYTVLETAEMMITISDNTATNMIIRRLGGIPAVNQKFQSWGMRETVIRTPLADLGGTNTTTPKELTQLLVLVSQGELLSLRSRDRLMEIMQGTVTDTLLPAGVADPRSIIAHKTGTIDNMVGDTGIIDMPNGKRYVATILMQRPTDDDRAQELIRQITYAAHQYLGQPPSVNPSMMPQQPVQPTQ